jgi:DNA-binding NtrC family response regulator
MSASEVPEPDDSALQVDEVDRIDLADKLQELSEQLQRAAELMYNRDRADELEERYLHNAEPDEYEQIKLSAKSVDEFRRTLTALRDFRRSYGRWERVIAEYALNNMGYTQRDAAKYLGVGVSTINRWAQHPLTIDEHH